jgi:hypothetical protein
MWKPSWTMRGWYAVARFGEGSPYCAGLLSVVVYDP